VTHRDTASSPPPPPDTPLQRFGALLRQYRQQRGLSQKALTARTGIPSTYISEIEQGLRNIAVLALLRLAHALDIPAAWLLVGLDPSATVPPPVVRAPLSSRGAQPTTGPHDAMPSLQAGDPHTRLHLLGATIRLYRQQQGLTHKALAAKTGLDNSYIGEIERGERNVSVLNLVRLAHALGLSVSHLLAPLDTSQRPSP
jgi:transcriptional regulator with XRE-family HTH domain